MCPFPPHGWLAPDGLPLLLRKQPIWAAGDTPHLMPVEQGLPWHPVATGLAGQAIPFVRPGQRVEEQGTWASRTQKHSEAGYRRPVDRGAWTGKTVKRPRQQPTHPQYANYWVPLTRKRHTMPHSAQPQHTNHWDPRTRKRHQQEHRPQRPTESSNPTQHAKGRTGDCPGPRKGTTTRRNVIQGAIRGAKEQCEMTHTQERPCSRGPRQKRGSSSPSVRGVLALPLPPHRLGRQASTCTNYIARLVNPTMRAQAWLGLHRGNLGDLEMGTSPRPP